MAVFLFKDGRLRGPAAFSTVGMRIQNEQSGSTSLFAQPLTLEPVPENRDQGTKGLRDQDLKALRGVLEARLEAVLEELSGEGDAPDATARQGHLALLKRWYYRPEARRPGEILFPDEAGAWSVRAILRAAGRVAGKSLASAQPG